MRIGISDGNLYYSTYSIHSGCSMFSGIYLTTPKKRVDGFDNSIEKWYNSTHSKTKTSNPQGVETTRC